MDEQRLIAGYKRGDSWAQKEIYETFAPVMLSLCVRYVKNKTDAEDILQDGFVKVFTQADKFQEKGSLAGWIRQIIVNTVMEHFREQKKRDWKTTIEENTDIPAEHLTTLEKMNADELLKCVTALPETYRIVFNLYAVEGYSYEEISLKMNTPENVIRTQFSRARKKLQIIVSEIVK